MNYLKIFSLLIIIFTLTNVQGQEVSSDKEIILKKLLDDYAGLQILFCKNSLSFETEIINGKSLKESLDINFIETMQRYSPPKNDNLISDFIDAKDIEFMISNTGSFKWEKPNYNFVTQYNCKKGQTNRSYINQIKISKPLFTKSGMFAIVFISEANTEYSVYLKAFKKKSEGWVSVINLSLQ